MMAESSGVYRGSVWRMPDGDWASYPLVGEDGEQVVLGDWMGGWPTWEEALAYVLGFLREPLPAWLVEGFDAHDAGVQARLVEDAEQQRRGTWLAGPELEEALAGVPNLAEEFPSPGRPRRWCRRWSWSS